jgi:hypothetical protein
MKKEVKGVSLDHALRTGATVEEWRKANNSKS